MTDDLSTEMTDLRKTAIARLRKRREFLQHLAGYVVVNGVLTVIWLLTTPDGFFWPVFPILGWGIGIVFHALDAFAPPMPTEQQIQRETHVENTQGFTSPGILVIRPPPPSPATPRAGQRAGRRCR